MTRISLLLGLVFSSFFLVQCGSSPKTDGAYFSIELLPKKTTYTPSEDLQLEVSAKLELEADSIQWQIQSPNGSKNISSLPLSLENLPMGTHKIKARVFTSQGIKNIIQEFKLLPAHKPELFGYTILERYPHDIKAYTQGLEFSDGYLYESTGQYGQSSLRQLEYKQGKVLRNEPLDNAFFAEGLTVFQDKIIQLTWRENTGLVYDKNSFQRIDQFQYDKSRQGWGLCNDGDYLYKSDGTHKIWRLDPQTYKELDYIEVYTNKLKIDQINELEWVDGRIYANIYQKNAIAIVHPKTGAVEGVINLKGLQQQVTQHSGLDVLNGIASDGQQGILYLTGKNWDQIFKVQITPK